MHTVPRAGLPDLTLPQRLDALAELVRLCAVRGWSDEFGPELLRDSEAVLRRAGERLRMSATHTVVAIAGGTGSGKSSLFNALSGATFSPTGVTRPTTRHVHACVWGMQGAAPLLDWLGVQRRHRYARASALDAGEADLDGLLLLDLPDHDSVVAASLATVDRMTKLADMLIWVMDPQKYADNAVHSRYLIPLAGHANVFTIVLNQIDLLTPEQATDCEADLRRLLDAEGLEGAQLIPVSARTGAGMEDLRNALVRAVSVSRAASERIAADIDAVLAGFTAFAGGDDPPETPPDSRAAPGGAGRRSGQAAGAAGLTGPASDSLPPWELSPPVEWNGQEPDWAAIVPALPSVELAGAFAQAAAVTAVCDAIQGAAEARSARYVTWPLGRLAHLRRRNDPLRGLSGAGAPSGPRAIAEAAGQPRRSDIDNAITAFADQVSAPLPRPWDHHTRDAARSRAGAIPEALSNALRDELPEQERVPGWWRLALVWQWLLVVVGVGGLAWIGVIIASHLGHKHSSSMLSDTSLLPWLGVMVVALCLLGWLTSTGSQNMVLLAADRERDRVEARLRERVGTVARDLVTTPVGHQLAEYDRFRRQLAIARGGSVAVVPGPVVGSLGVPGSL